MTTLYKQFNCYEETVEYLENSSMFSIKLGLERIKEFLKYIGNPQKGLNVIHIAGTNGKGSVLKYIESILIASGYNTGSFTSPHLIEFTERISFNNESISKEDFVYYTNIIFDKLNSFKNENLTLFEFLTVMGILYFTDKKTDIVLLETGLGGRFDATNIIDSPIASIITHIDLDHTEYLGNNIEDIAKEKAGIIKNDSNLILNNTNKAFDILKSVAESRNSTVITSNPSAYNITSDTFGLKQIIKDINTSRIYFVPLIGEHQVENLSLAISCIEVLRKKGFNIPDEGLKKGIEIVRWPGRGQYIKNINTLVDGAHNPSGAKVLRKLVDNYFKGMQPIWVIGTLNTKDSKSIISNLLRDGDTVVFTEPLAVNATSAIKLQKHASKTCLKLRIYNKNTLGEAYKLADQLRRKNELIVVTGSLYLVGEFLNTDF